MGYTKRPDGGFAFLLSTVCAIVTRGTLLAREIEGMCIYFRMHAGGLMGYVNFSTRLTFYILKFFVVVAFLRLKCKKTHTHKRTVNVCI